MTSIECERGAAQRVFVVRTSNGTREESDLKAAGMKNIKQTNIQRLAEELADEQPQQEGWQRHWNSAHRFFVVGG